MNIVKGVDTSVYLEMGAALQVLTCCWTHDKMLRPAQREEDIQPPIESAKANKTGQISWVSEAIYYIEQRSNGDRIETLNSLSGQMKPQRA